MALTSAGATLLAQCLISDGPTFANSANAYLGVGDSSATQSATLTDLQGTAVRKAMMTGYPQRTGSEVTFRAAFSEGSGEFAWREWATFNAASSGTMITRKVEDLGTKGTSQVWTLTVAITFTTADAT